MLAAAFAGGLILNLMPCVLPVLSLKIFDFVQRAAGPKKGWKSGVFAHGLSFAAGTVATAFFWFGNDRIVFLGDLVVDGRNDAYVVDVTQTPAVPVMLNGVLPPGGAVSTLFAQSPQ